MTLVSLNQPVMSFKVRTATEKEIVQEGTVDGKSYPPPVPIQPLSRTTSKSKQGSTGSSDSETDGDECQVKSRVVLLSKGEGWTLKLPKNRKYRVVLIQERSTNHTFHELFADNDYSNTKEAFNKTNTTLAPLLEDGCFLLSKDVLKHILMPEPLSPDCIGPQLLKVMEKEPGLHSDWQHLIQKLTAPKSDSTKQAKQQISGLDSLKRKIQKAPNPNDSKSSLGKRFSLVSVQADLAAATVAIPKSATPMRADEDKEASEEVWKLFRRGTLKAKHETKKTWLIEATKKQYVRSCLKLILSQVVNVNEVDMATGDTALHVAVRCENITLVKLLLAYRADPRILNKKKESPYDAAIKLSGPNASSIIKCLETIKSLKTKTSLYFTQNNKLPRKKNSSEKFLLSLDGGGMRSVIMCHILTAIEKRMKELNASCKPLQTYFDYIAGTSAGSIIGGLLLYSDISVSLAGMYLYNFMIDVFCCQKSDRIKKLKGFIVDTVGADKCLSETESGNMIVTSTLANVSPNKLHLMTSYGEPRDGQLGPDDRKVWEALVASSAAPTYFPAFGPFLDGGLMANNPTLPAMTDILTRQDQKKSTKLGCVLSLGTGYLYPPQAVDNFEVYVPGFNKDLAKNLVQSSMGLMSLMSHFMSQTTQSNGEVVKQAEAWCNSIGASYFRLSPPLQEDVPPDMKSIETFVSLIHETEIYVLQQCSLIDAIAKTMLTK